MDNSDGTVTLTYDLGGNHAVVYICADTAAADSLSADCRNSEYLFARSDLTLGLGTSPWTFGPGDTWIQSGVGFRPLEEGIYTIIYAESPDDLDYTWVAGLAHARIASTESMVSAGSSASEPIPDWVQAYARAGQDAACEDGWDASWQKWAEEISGGWVCTRSIPSLG